MKNLVYVVDVRNLILGNQSTLKRHREYAKLLTSRSDKNVSLGLIHFKHQNSITFGIQDDLQTMTLPSNPLAIVKYLLQNRTEKTEDFSVKVLIAGDPWESALCAYMLKLLFFPSAKIQVQIHGDIGNRIWIHQTIKNYVRSLFARFALQFADQLRTVSRNQTDLLVSRYRISKLKCRVIPVPSLFLIDADIPSEPHIMTPSIGFVGRIQADRGTEKLLDLVAKLRSQNLSFSVVIAGDGPERQILEVKLATLLPRENVKFLENLNQTEMHKAWSQIGILVSTPPTESYGRAIREALAWGIPVWATPSSGVSDLQLEVSQNYVKNLAIDLPAKRQAEIFNELLSVKIPFEVRKSIVQADLKALHALIHSWIDLCD